MSALNYKHLRYFWMVAKTGSIAKAASQLNLTPHSISGQLSEFAEALGVALFRKSGRSLELTDTGRRIVSYAETIFSTGDELLELVRQKLRHDVVQDWLRRFSVKTHCLPAGRAGVETQGAGAADLPRRAPRQPDR